MIKNESTEIRECLHSEILQSEESSKSLWYDLSVPDSSFSEQDSTILINWSQISVPPCSSQSQASCKVRASRISSGSPTRIPESSCVSLSDRKSDSTRFESSRIMMSGGQWIRKDVVMKNLIRSIKRYFLDKFHSLSDFKTLTNRQARRTFEKEVR